MINYRIKEEIYEDERSYFYPQVQDAQPSFGNNCDWLNLTYWNETKNVPYKCNSYDEAFEIIRKHKQSLMKPINEKYYNIDSAKL